MNETTNSLQNSPGPKNLGVPIAIVLAGGLVALAIYFGGTGTSTTTRTATNGAARATAQPVASRAPAQPITGDIRPVTDEDHIKGAKDAKVTIIEYSDFECPFCKRFHPTMQQIVDEYPNDVRWVYRQFPLESLHRKAIKEAEATECAAEQGRFWELADLIFETTPSNDGLNLDELPNLARQAGVPNIAQFETCLESGKYLEHVEADIADAQAAGGRGTPYSVVLSPSGEKFPIGGAQPYESVKQVVEKALGN